MKKLNGKIKSIKLNMFGDRAFWNITIVDMNGNELGSFGSTALSVAVDFREQTFSIMQILKNFKLLNLDCESKSYPIYVDDSEYFISCVANEDGDFLDIDRKRNIISFGSGKNNSKLKKRELTGVSSASGCLLIDTRGEYFSQGLTIGGVYYGCKALYGSSKDRDNDAIETCADNFRKVICGIMKICKEDELIKNNNYPAVVVQLDDKKNIVAVGSKDGSTYLTITDAGYELVDGSTFTTKEETTKVLKKIRTGK